MNTTFLLDHARQKIWSSPQQDLQAVIKPHRLTDVLGAKDNLSLAWLTIPMPSTDSRYHVYQLGRLHPALVGMLPIRQSWTSAAAQCNVQGMIIDVYTAKGKKLPLFDCFFRVTANDNLIIAIRDQGRVMTLVKETLFIRFYSNAYFESDDANTAPRLPESMFSPVLPGIWTFPDDIRTNRHPGDILVQGVRVRTRNDVLQLDQKVAQLRELGFGGVTCFYNGEWVTDFSGFHYSTLNVRQGDWAEFVFDASIEKIQTFKISDLKTFQSIRDGVNKYILMKDTPWTGEVFYKDDFDFYLLQPQGNRHRGRYYYRNDPTSVRMITHQDYSIPVNHVVRYVDADEGFTDPMQWTVSVVFRRSGYSKKTLIHEHSRLAEFFRLSPDKRLAAFQGINSTVPFWRADYLENTDLAVLFGERPFSFTGKQVEDALGFYGVSRLINPCLIETKLASNGVNWQTELPIGLQQLATIFEYDQHGYLLGYRVSEGTVLYVCNNNACRYIEGIAGNGGKKQGTFFGDGPHQLDPDWDYGFYKKVKVGGVPTGEWQVAEPSDYTIDSANQAWWNLSEAAWHLVIRTNKDFLLYEIDVDARDGLTVFSVQAIEENQHEPDNFVEDLPYGQLDIYFNNKALIRGVDYTGKWPQFVVTNSEFIAAGGLQRVLVRATGLPENVDGKPVDRMSTETGFVKYGKLSRNRKYNARNGKVQRYVVRGKVLPGSKLNFSEDTGAIKPSPVANGDPYSIEDVVVPVGNFTKADTYTLRELDVERDVIVEAYMGQFFTDSPEDNPNPILERYRVVSPFMTKIIHDIKHGLLSVPDSILPLTQFKMEQLLKDYMYLLPYDPITIGFDWQYVQVIPHADAGVITVGVHEYHVLALANRVYFEERLDLSKFIKVDPAWRPSTLPPL